MKSSLILGLKRLSGDWMEHYGHPVVAVETFVDPERFNGTVYTASDLEELGLANGNGRVSRDYYERHDRPKRLFVKELSRGARRSLQADKLKPSLAVVEAKSRPRCTRSPEELASLSERFRRVVDDYHTKRCLYPVHALLKIMAAAHLSESPRGQKDLEKFAACVRPATSTCTRSSPEKTTACASIGSPEKRTRRTLPPPNSKPTWARIMIAGRSVWSPAKKPKF